MPAGNRIFYGWYVAYALCVVSTTTAGLGFYNVSVLLDAFIVERGFGAGVTGIATGLFFAGSGAAGVIAGRLMERVDARIVIIVSACVCAVALMSVGLLREPWQLYAFYIVFGLCYGGCGLVPASTIVARWFSARRAQALAIASTGLSLGGILLTPVSAFLIARLGLAGAAPYLALGFAIGVVPATALVVRARPQALGLEPDGAERPRGVHAAAPAGTVFAEARRSRFFVALTAAYLFILGAQVGGIAHIYRLTNLRVDQSAAALAVALVAGASLAGRLASGWVIPMMPLRGFVLLLVASQAGALVFLAHASSAAAVLTGAALFGATAGTILMMQQLQIADAFGTRDYGRIYSVSVLVTGVGVSIGPAVVGLINDATGGYTAPFLAIAVTSALGGVMMALAGPPPR